VGAPGFLFFPFPLLVADGRSPALEMIAYQCALPEDGLRARMRAVARQEFFNGGTRLNHLAERHVESSVGGPATTSRPHLAVAYKNLYSEAGL
jgi:hypothetical protein